jgi:hypothetical protein
MPTVDQTLLAYESIARTVIEWVARIVTVQGELLVSVDFVELSPGNLELQIDCVARK